MQGKSMSRRWLAILLAAAARRRQLDREMGIPGAVTMDTLAALSPAYVWQTAHQCGKPCPCAGILPTGSQPLHGSLKPRRASQAKAPSLSSEEPSGVHCPLPQGPGIQGHAVCFYFDAALSLARRAANGRMHTRVHG